MLESTGLRPKIDRTLPLSEAAEAIATMIAGEVFGKIVLVP
jgi:NADPH:quinone reductase-like Zn-dependent oxidoreductase